MDKPSMTIGGKEVHLKTKEELAKELAEAKAELKKQLDEGLIDGVEYNKKLIVLEAPEEYKPKPKTHLTLAMVAIIIVMVLAFIPAAIFINWRYYLKTTLTLEGVPNYSDVIKSSLNYDPIQINLEEPVVEIGEYKGRPIEITYKAYYDITGIVTSVKDYWGFGAYNTLAPRDICMIWGSLAEKYPSPNMEFYHGERYCVAKGSDIPFDLSSKGAYGSTHYGSSLISNNHLIPSAAEVRDAFLGFGAGDIVRIVGYLVQVKYDGILLNSSMTRDDVMFDSDSGTCEVIYVIEAEKIGHKF